MGKVRSRPGYQCGRPPAPCRTERRNSTRTEDLVVVFDLEILARFRSSRSTGTDSLASVLLLLVLIFLSASSRCFLRSSGRSSRFPRPAVRLRRSLSPLRSRGAARVAGRRFGTFGRPFTRTGLDARRNLEVFFVVVVFVVVVIIFLVVNVFDRAFVRIRSCPGKDVVQVSPGSSSSGAAPGPSVCSLSASVSAPCLHSSSVPSSNQPA